MRFGVLLCHERARIGLAVTKGATSSCRGLPPWWYLSGVLEVCIALKVHVRVDICPVLKG